MKMKQTDQSGFSIIEALLILVAVCILGFTGWYVYHAKQASDQNYSAVTNSTVPTYKNKTSTKAATAAKANPYAGWSTASLQYEKMSFKYPPSWQLSNTSKDEQATGGTATPGADTAVLTSPNGLLVSLESGVAGVGDSDGIDSVLPGAQHINTLGGSYYLDFYAHGPDNPTVAQGACVDKSASASGIPYIASKNIQLANIIAPASDIGNPAADLFCIQYKNVTAEQQDLTLEHDASYNDAKLIIESLAY
jgi:hypothetical protein